jgi:hypothetical protein
VNIEDEFDGAHFGDQRLSKRLTKIASDLAAAPDDSFPQATADSAALEGLYRFLGNELVDPATILAPHFAATARRIRGADSSVVIAHDSSEFIFHREGMGKLGENRIGFLGHFSVAVTQDATREPLGCIGFEALIRTGTDQRTPRERRRDPDCEERRWWNGIDAIERLVRDPGKMIHVADREADSYELLGKLVGASYRFVLRLCYDRLIDEPEVASARISDAIYGARRRFTFDVDVAPSPAVSRGAHRKAERHKRTATVAVSAMPLRLVRPRWTRIEGPPTLDVNVVLVREVDPPPGDTPIEWRLVTTEPIRTDEDLVAIVQTYRARWMIEEFFRALKQGCAVEKRQLETAPAILNAIAIFIPIAWQLLALRTFSRDASDRPAVVVLSAMQITLLQRHPKVRLRYLPTVRDALLAVAKLGGHIPNNGDPGWLVLGRGFMKLLALEEGALLIARECDQS